MPFIVHYAGELTTISKTGKHGNIKDKSNAPIYQRTKPSTLNKLRELVAQTNQPSKVYTNYNLSNRPRNKKQVRNQNYVII